MAFVTIDSEAVNEACAEAKNSIIKNMNSSKQKAIDDGLPMQVAMQIVNSASKQLNKVSAIESLCSVSDSVSLHGSDLELLGLTS